MREMRQVAISATGQRSKRRNQTKLRILVTLGRGILTPSKFLTLGRPSNGRWSFLCASRSGCSKSNQKWRSVRRIGVIVPCVVFRVCKYHCARRPSRASVTPSIVFLSLSGVFQVEQNPTSKKWHEWWAAKPSQNNASNRILCYDGCYSKGATGSNTSETIRNPDERPYEPNSHYEVYDLISKENLQKTLAPENSMFLPVAESFVERDCQQNQSIGHRDKPVQNFSIRIYQPIYPHQSSTPNCQAGSPANPHKPTPLEKFMTITSIIMRVCESSFLFQLTMLIDVKIDDQPKFESSLQHKQPLQAHCHDSICSNGTNRVSWICRTMLTLRIQCKNSDHEYIYSFVNGTHQSSFNSAYSRLLWY